MVHFSSTPSSSGQLRVLAAVTLFASALGCGSGAPGRGARDVNDSGTPPPPAVAGRVVDSYLTPMQGVRVWLAHHDAVYTDSEGRFAFEDVELPYTLAAQWQSLTKVAVALTSPQPEITFDHQYPLPLPRSCAVEGVLRNAPSVDGVADFVPSFASTCPVTVLSSGPLQELYGAAVEWGCAQGTLTGTLDALEYNSSVPDNEVTYLAHGEKSDVVLDPASSPARVDIDMEPISTAELAISLRVPAGMTEGPAVQVGVAREDRRLGTGASYFQTADQLKIHVPKIPGWAEVVDAEVSAGYHRAAAIHWMGAKDAFPETVSLAFLEPPRLSPAEDEEYGFAVLELPDARLSWTPGAGPESPGDAAYEYVVRFEVGIETFAIVEVATTDTSLELARLLELPIELPLGDPFRWDVETIERSGGRVARTSRAAFKSIALR